MRWPTETARTIWTVKTVDHTAGTATVVRSSPTSEHDISRIAPIAKLQPLTGRPRRNKPIEIPWYEDDLPIERPKRERLALVDAEDRESPLAPIKPKRTIDELLDGITFSERCLRQYKRSYAQKVPWQKVPDMLRREVRNYGRLERVSLSTTLYARVSTGRFEIHLDRRPSEDAPLQIEALHPVSKRRRRPRAA